MLFPQLVRLAVLTSILPALAFDGAAQPAPAYTFTTYVGRNNIGYVDGEGTQARFHEPAGLACDADGNLYVVDPGTNLIRKITPAASVSTFAGTPTGWGLVDGPAASARFGLPQGVAVGADGTVYIADTGNAAIRIITPDGSVRILAGGRSGSQDGYGTGATFNLPEAVAVNAAGVVYVADSGNNTVRRIEEGNVTTLAGLAGASAGAVDGAGSDARFNGPKGIAVDANGTVYVADTSNHIIRKVTPSGVVTTLAGSPGISGNSDGAGDAARFNAPTDIAVDDAGTIYVVDQSGSLRKITPEGVVTSLASGFSYPRGVAFDRSSGVFFVADTGHHVIKRVTPNGSVTVFAGADVLVRSADGVGLNAQFTSPRGLTVAADGTVFVADSNAYVIRKVTPGLLVTTWAGSLVRPIYQTVDGQGSNAGFGNPTGIAVDAAGNLFVADFKATIRKIDATGYVSTVAGAHGLDGSLDGEKTAARFNAPHGLAVDQHGNLYVADTFNHSIRKIDAAGQVTTPYGVSGVEGTVDGIGNAARFGSPTALAFDRDGSLFVADGHRVRRISPEGVVTTVAGTANATGSIDGVGAAATFGEIKGLAVDRAGNVFVAENTTHVIRRITPDGTVVTIGGLAGSIGTADGVGSAARFNEPWGLALDRFGHLYIVDSGNNTIRKGVIVGATAPAITKDPVAKAAGAGRQASFTLTATGLPAPQFQWQRKRAGESDFVALSEIAEFSGVETATLTVTTAAAMTGDQFRCVVENGIGPAVTSGTATLTVVPPPSFSSEAETTFTVGAAGRFQVAAAGATVLALKSGALPAWAHFDPATGILSGTPTELAAPLQLVFEAGNAAVTPTEQPFTLKISAGPLVVADPVAHTANAGATAILSVDAAGVAPLSYRWTKDGVPVVNSTRISGADGPVLALGRTQLADGGTYAVTVTGPDGTAVTSRAAVLSVAQPPTISTAPASAIVASGARANFTVAATSNSPLAFQWLYNGDPVAGENASMYAIAAVNPGWSGLYSVRVSDAATAVETTPVILGVPIDQKLWGWGSEAGADIVHPNGNLYDQVLLTSSTVALKADPGQVTRVSFIDLSDDIVQVEFSGAGTLHVQLKNAAAPAAPLFYNQNVSYVKGHAGITIVGADETTHLSVFSVGRVTAVNQGLFRPEVNYDGMADIAFIAISSANGKFGGLYAGNAVCSETTGVTGIFAPGVEFTYRVVISDINASDSAQPWLLLGAAEDVRIAGGDLAQANHRPLAVGGFSALQMIAGSNSHGVGLPAQPLRARVERDGDDITDELTLRY